MSPPGPSGKIRSTTLSDQKRTALQNAWHAVKNGKMTIYAAAKHFNLSKTTLGLWCKKPDISDVQRPGRPSCYSESNYGPALDAIINQKLSVNEAALRFDLSANALYKRISRHRKATSGTDTMGKSNLHENISKDDDGIDFEQYQENSQ